MTKERELLRRALDRIDWVYPSDIALKHEIRAFLSTHSDDAEEPVYLARRKGLEDFFTCTKDRYDELSALDLFETKIAYLHPPKPAEPEAETIETLKAENFKLASGQCTEGGPWGDEGGTPYCKYAARKPMMEEEINKAYQIRFGEHNFVADFWEGVRFAEKHHGIGGDDDKQS